MAFGAEKRSKEFFHDVFIHAGAVVDNVKFNEIPFLFGGYQPDLPFFVHIFIKQAGIDGIGHKVQQNLMNGIGVHLDFIDGMIKFRDDFNVVLPGLILHQAANVFCDLIGIANFILGLSFFGIGK